MRIATSALLISVMTLTSCATVRDSRVNPFNWFGGSTSQPVQAEAPKANNPLLPERTGIFAKQRAREGVYQGKPVDQVTELVIERVPGGALIRATGITLTQGAYDVQLTPETDTETPVDGVLTYRLEALAPSNAIQGGATRTRTVTVARHVSDKALQGVRTVRVVAERNVRTTRRR
jgi:hypothetical protein